MSSNNSLEHRLRRHLIGFLDAFLGEGRDEGHNRHFSDAISVVVDPTHERFGSVYDFKAERGGGPLLLVELAGIDESEVVAWLGQQDEAGTADQTEAKTSSKSANGTAHQSAHKFDAINEAAGGDDGRIEKYLAARGLPMPPLGVALALSRHRSRPVLAAFATDATGDAAAVQVLELDPDGGPTTWFDGKKMRLTFPAVTGWKKTAAFRIPGESDEVVLVEGVEDAIALHACGWTGPISATLGKGGFATYGPPEATVVLVPDGDVAVDGVEIAQAVDFHARAGRNVRVAKLPDGLDPADLVKAGRAPDLLAAVNNAQPRRSCRAKMEQAFQAYPFDEDGDERFEVEVKELAKRLSVSVETLRKARERRRPPQIGSEDVGLVSLPEPVPWSDPVAGETLFDELVRALEAHVVFPKIDGVAHGGVAVALWIAVSHTFEPFDSEHKDVFRHAPRLKIGGPVKRVGKSLLLEVIGYLSRRPITGSSVSAAVLFRLIEKLRPTILLDEVDQGGLARDDSAIKQIINDGFSRGGLAMRIGGENRDQIRSFRVFGAVALCGIGNLPDTVEDRCVRLRLQRKGVDQEVERLTPARVDYLKVLAGKVLRWTTDSRSALAAADEPEFPSGGSDRDRDVWRPLLQVAAVMGPTVLERAKAAFVVFVDEPAASSESEELLRDVRDAALTERVALRKFKKELTRIGTTRLAEMLNANGGPWAEKNHGKGITSRWLGDRLYEFGLRSRNMRDPRIPSKFVLGHDVEAILAVAAHYGLTGDSAEQEDRETPSQSTLTPPTSPTAPTEDASSVEDVGAVGDVGAQRKGKPALRRCVAGNGEASPKPKAKPKKATKSPPPVISPEAREALIERLRPEALAKRERALKTRCRRET